MISINPWWAAKKHLTYDLRHCIITLRTLHVYLRTHRHKQALVLFDGAHTGKEGNHHDNGAHDDKHITQCEEGEFMEEYSEVVVDHKVDPKTQNAAATELK